jgi:hypothetical protein
MQKKNLVRGFPSFIELDNEICDDCAIGKQHRDKFPPRHFRASEPLALVHADILWPHADFISRK